MGLCLRLKSSSLISQRCQLYQLLEMWFVSQQIFLASYFLIYLSHHQFPSLLWHAHTDSYTSLVQRRGCCETVNHWEAERSAESLVTEDKTCSGRRTLCTPPPGSSIHSTGRDTEREDSFIHTFITADRHLKTQECGEDMQVYVRVCTKDNIVDSKQEILQHPSFKTWPGPKVYLATSCVQPR